MIAAPRWTVEELSRERQIAIDRFRAERTTEPLSRYLAIVDRLLPEVRAVIDRLGGGARLQELVVEASTLDVVRYLAGPPISADDLAIVAGVRLSPKSLKQRPDDAAAVARTITTTLDPRRFPWLLAGQSPTPEQRTAAIMSTVSLMATQRLATERRNQSKSVQEDSVYQALMGIGFKHVARRTINAIKDAPLPGEFCGEAKLGPRKADIICRLHDDRILAIECKVSNSSVNSIKRLNNDAAAKATVWLTEFGTRMVVPSAMLSGVFNLANLIDAQERGLSLFWAHDLQAFQRWVSG